MLLGVTFVHAPVPSCTAKNVGYGASQKRKAIEPDPALPAVVVSASVAVAFVTPAADAVTVMVELLAAAPEAAAIVSVAVFPVTFDADNVAVTPAGAPLTARSTAPVNGAVLVMVSVLVPLAPAATDSVAGDSAIAIDPVAGTVVVTPRDAVAFATPVPEPVTTMVPVDAAVPAATATVKVAELPVTLALESVAVTPVGAPLTERFTAPVNDPVRVIVMVLVLFVPAASDSDVGERASVKAPVAAAPWTVSAYDAVLSATPLPLARTVSVALPATAAEVAVRVTVELVPPAATVAGLADAVTPLGSPSTLRSMAPVKPPALPTVTAIVVVLPPAVIDPLLLPRETEIELGSTIASVVPPPQLVETSAAIARRDDRAQRLRTGVRRFNIGCIL